MDKLKEFFGGLTKDKVLGLLRHVLTFVGGLLVMFGIMEDGMWLEISGIISTFVGGLWSWIQKQKTEKKMAALTNNKA